MDESVMGEAGISHTLYNGCNHTVPIGKGEL